MWWKALGVFLVLLVVGAASGYALGDHSTDQPGSIPTAEPMPAVSPSVPTPSAVVCLPDPPAAALPVDLPTHVVHLRANGFPLTVGVPQGWKEDRQGNTWFWAVPAIGKNTYILRVRIVASDHEAVNVAKAARIVAFRTAAQNNDLSDFVVVSDVADTLIATYVDHGYCRVTMERWLTLGGSTAYADIAVTGRMTDQAGLADLLASTTESMVAG